MSYSIPASAYDRTRKTKAQLMADGMSETEAQQLVDAQAEREVGGGMSRAELQDFETLIGRLEGSKMRQASQANRARQRDVMAGGLASMMTNF
jgi:hypothetical protein